MLHLLDEIPNTTKMKARESKERKLENESRRNMVSCFNIYIVMFPYMSSTVEVGRWLKLNEMFCFWNIFHLLCLTATTFMKIFMKRFQE